jgi:hypothetical protein
MAGGDGLALGFYFIRMRKFQGTSHECVRSLEDSHDGRSLERINGECRTRQQRLATVSHRFDQHHHSLIAAPPEATHLLEQQGYLPSTPPHEHTHGVQGRFGQRPQECRAPSRRLTPTVN